MSEKTSSGQPLGGQTVSIRKATIDDAEAVTRLHKGEGWCYDDPIVMNDYWDDSFDKESILVAEVDGKTRVKVGDTQFVSDSHEVALGVPTEVYPAILFCRELSIQLSVDR